jgi:hypothetical protein
MVFDRLFENLPLCITNSYYPKILTNYLTPKFVLTLILILCVALKITFQKNNLPGGYIFQKQLPANTGLDHAFGSNHSLFQWSNVYPICGFILALSKDGEGQGPLEWICKLGLKSHLCHCFVIGDLPIRNCCHHDLLSKYDLLRGEWVIDWLGPSRWGFQTLSILESEWQKWMTSV